MREEKKYKARRYAEMVRGAAVGNGQDDCCIHHAVGALRIVRGKASPVVVWGTEAVFFLLFAC